MYVLVAKYFRMMKNNFRSAHIPITAKKSPSNERALLKPIFIFF